MHLLGHDVAFYARISEDVFKNRKRQTFQKTGWGSRSFGRSAGHVPTVKILSELAEN